MASLKDKTVIITGASSGIGKATAIAFAKKGANVVLAARRLEKLEQLQQHLASYDAGCLCVKTDVSDESQVADLFKDAEKRFGRVDILVNNAGRGLKANITDITLPDWHSVINTNLTGVFLCTKEAVKMMKRKKTRGHVITVSSVAGLFGAPGYSAYCASKHGVTGFKRSAKLELMRYRIKTSTIHPWRVDSDFFDIYKKRPHRSQMLSPNDIADYILAKASRNPLKVIGVRILLMFKRIYYPIRCLVR